MFNSSSLRQIDVRELVQLIAEDSDSLQLIDVREPEEVSIAKIPGFVVLPLSQFASWSSSISTRFNRDRATIVLCHHGIRSAQMCQWLVSQGFTNVGNVTGGIDAYAIMVDSSIPRY